MDSNRLIGQRIGSWIGRGLSAVGLGGRKKADTSKTTLVVTLPDGRKLTTAHLRGLTGRMNVRDGKLLEVQGTVRYEIIGAGNVPPGAKELHEEGRIAGGRAEYAKAVEFFEAASRMAPEWPYPVYDQAFTHLLMGDAESALMYYRRTLHLAPRGFSR